MTLFWSGGDSITFPLFCSLFLFYCQIGHFSCCFHLFMLTLHYHALLCCLCHTVAIFISLFSPLLTPSIYIPNTQLPTLPFSPPSISPCPVFVIAKSMPKVHEQWVSGYPLPLLPRKLCMCMDVCVRVSLFFFSHTNTHILPSVSAQPVLKRRAPGKTN